MGVLAMGILALGYTAHFAMPQWSIVAREVGRGFMVEVFHTVLESFRAHRMVAGYRRVAKHRLHRPQRIERLVFFVMVALFLFALIEREARRVVQRSGQVFTGLRPEGRDHLPVTGEQLIAAFAPLSLSNSVCACGMIVDVLTPTALHPVQDQILERLGLIKPDVYLHPSITPHPT
jgi:hypothetical protein